MALTNMLEVFEYNQHFVAMMNIINAARLNPPKEGQRKGMTWKLIDGHRVWYKKEIVKC